MKTMISRWLQGKSPADTSKINDRISNVSQDSYEYGAGGHKRPEKPERRQNADNSSLPEGITIEQRLAAGSFGKVYTGRWHGVQVAIKVIRHDAASTTQVANEVALAKRMEHPNIIACYHFTTQAARPDPRLAISIKAAADAQQQVPSLHSHTQRPLPPGGPAGGASGTKSDVETWIVQELCTGGSLDKFLKAGSLLRPGSGVVDMAKVLWYALDVARGMAHLHSHSVCHGDLKAANVLMAPAGDSSLNAPVPEVSTEQDSDVSTSGLQPHNGSSGRWGRRPKPQRATDFVAKVADFGLSRALAGKGTHVTTFTYGTLGYMPPELLSHGQLRLSVDVYSFAIILWEMLVGHPPYQGMLDGQIIHAVVVERSRPPLPPWTPHEYASLCEACWSHEQDARPGFPDIVTRLELLLGQAEYLQAQIEEWQESGGEDG